MADPTPQPVLPLHTHYTLRACGTVYPAMKNPPGHEDANPSDWRPATAQEIAAHKHEVQQILARRQRNADGSTKTTGTGAVGVTGGVIRLAEEDPVEPAAPSIPPPPAHEVVDLSIPPAPAVIPVAAITIPDANSQTGG